MNQKKALIKKSKVKFPNLDCNQIFKTKKAVLIDLDDTLYPYWPAHIKGLEEVLKYLKKRYSSIFKSEDLVSFNSSYQKHRKIVIDRLYPNGMCRNRYILFLSWMESVNIKRAYLVALKLEKLYWNSFLSNIKPDSKATSFLKYCYLHSIPVVVITDMQADMQIKKLKKLKMDKYIDYLVTSDEAGKEKPYKDIFKLALKKLGLKASEVIMLGDNEVKDLQGAEKLGIDTYKVD